MSTITVALKPLGAFGPGIAFGMAMAWAGAQTSLARPPRWKTVTLVFASVIGYFLAGIASLLCLRFTWDLSSFRQSIICGSVGGGVGAGFLMVGWLVYCGRNRCRTAIVLIPVGALLGVVFPMITMYLHDQLHVPHPLEYLTGLVVWQVPVAGVLGWVARTRAY